MYQTITNNSVTINPELANKGIIAELQELWKYRNIVWTMIERDLRMRYKGSFLGIVWSMLMPLAQAAIFTFVFGYIMGASVKNQSAYIFCALVAWLYFQTSILDSAQSVLSQIALIKKVYFPREIPVIACVGANLIHFLISIVVFIVYRWGILGIFDHWRSIGPPPVEILYLPLIIFIETMLALGISLYVAAMNVFYEDIKFIVTIILMFLMYLTPVIYSVESIVYSQKIPASLHMPIYRFFLLNPISWCITAFKQVFFGSVPTNVGTVQFMTAPFDIRYGLIALCVSLLVFIYGYNKFNSMKWKFAERP